MKNNFATLLTTIVMLSGCAGGTFKVTSDAPARIERDGVTACQATPCEVGGNFRADAFGACVGAAYTMLEAFPLDESGITQTKRVFGGCGKEYDVHFEMLRTSGIKTFSGDKQSSDENTIKSMTNRLRSLDTLLKEEVITPQEHEESRQKILNEI